MKLSHTHFDHTYSIIRLTVLILITFAVSFLFIGEAHAEIKEYDLTVDYKEVNLTGKQEIAMAINGSIPGPILYFNEGDTARINVTNNMDIRTSIHWHGILVPNREDGVPYLTTPPIEPGATYTYEFLIKHSGTYWYHSHTGLQEQVGVYGSIVISPKEKREDIEEPYADYALVLSDWTDESPNEVLRDLKRGSEYQSFKKKTMQTLYGVFKAKAVTESLKRSFHRMPPMDISDVAYDLFLINGKPTSTLDLPAGTKVRLRVINAGASTYFYLNYAGGKMKVISADGMNVKPTEMNRILIAIGETYDVLITIPEGGAYEFRATAQDGSGHASLFMGKGDRAFAADVPRPNLYRMKHEHSMKHHKNMKTSNDHRPLPPYAKLKSLERTELAPGNKTREITLNLTGDMERYVWTINNKTLSEADKILIRKGENVRFILVNKTMMHHPMHLHGHFFRVLNGHGDYSPLKHTVDVPPLSKKTIMEFEANEEKDWFFHCHVLYHMMSGMSRIVSYEGSVIDPDIKEMRPNLYKDPIYYWADVTALSNMTEGGINMSNTRNTLSAEWEAGFREEEYEVELTYNRYLDRFITVLAGASLADDHKRGVLGIKYLLPFLIDGTAWIDTEAELRVTLEKEIHLTERLSTFGETHYDTESKWEWKAGGAIMMGKKISLVGQYHSEFGGGGGILVKF